MSVLVDTPIWSIALQRKKLSPADALSRDALAGLIHSGEAQIVGPIRQELLSGIRDRGQFEAVRDHLRAFLDLPLGSADYEVAAEMSNECRRHGVQGSSVDFLICAAAHRHGSAIFTTDRDFARYAEYLPIALH